MTEMQGKIIQELEKKHGLQKNTAAYFLMLLGVGYDMSTEEIEGYLFHADTENMIEKDYRRICMLLDIPMPEKQANGEKSLEYCLRKTISNWKDAGEKVKSYESFFKEQGVSFSEAEKAEDVRIVFGKKETQKELEESRQEQLERYEAFFERQGVSFSEVEKAEDVNIVFGEKKTQRRLYERLLAVLLQEKEFSSGQIEQLKCAAENSMPEEEILKFAKPDIPAEKMAKYIEFHKLQNSLEQRPGILQKLRLRKGEKTDE